MACRWYVVHALSGNEKKVAKSITEQAEKKGVAHLFEQVLVPVEAVVEVRGGQRKSSEKKFLPGYILVKMDMTDAAWHLVKDIPQVTGFLGGGSKPLPVPEAEVERILKQIEEGTSAPKHTIIFEVGESVKVIDGPFESFIGVVEEVDLEKTRLKVAVSIFGRSTPIELDFTQVAKA